MCYKQKFCCYVASIEKQHCQCLAKCLMTALIKCYDLFKFCWLNHINDLPPQDKPEREYNINCLSKTLFLIFYVHFLTELWFFSNLYSKYNMMRKSQHLCLKNFCGEFGASCKVWTIVRVKYLNIYIEKWR